MREFGLRRVVRARRAVEHDTAGDVERSVPIEFVERRAPRRGQAVEHLAVDRQAIDGELLDIGVKAGLVEKSGAWFSYDSVRIGQGRENAKTFLREHPEMADKLEKAIRANLKGLGYGG